MSVRNATARYIIIENYRFWSINVRVYVPVRPRPEKYIVSCIPKTTKSSRNDVSQTFSTDWNGYTDSKNKLDTSQDHTTHFLKTAVPHSSPICPLIEGIPAGMCHSGRTSRSLSRFLL